ncbi:Hpt domain-containing protein [Vibrio sp. B1Z05]|nr:Hpt domain-containing protein [Vibrio sp. B1Z05]
MAVPEPLIDHTTVQQIISDTSVEVLPILIDSYLEESQQRITIMAKAAKDKDYSTLEFESHTLAGTSLAIGVCALGKLAKTIELECQNKQYVNALQNAELLTNLALESQSALQSLKDEL